MKYWHVKKYWETVQAAYWENIEKFAPGPPRLLPVGVVISVDPMPANRCNLNIRVLLFER